MVRVPCDHVEGRLGALRPTEVLDDGGERRLDHHARRRCTLFRQALTQLPREDRALDDEHGAGLGHLPSSSGAIASAKAADEVARLSNRRPIRRRSHLGIRLSKLQ